MRRVAIDQLEEHDPEAVDVGAVIGGFALELLRRHVMERSERRCDTRCSGGGAKQHREKNKEEKRNQKKIRFSGGAAENRSE